MQSIFPAIPKNSASAVEWEEALKSKWDEHGGWSPERLLQEKLALEMSQQQRDSTDFS